MKGKGALVLLFVCWLIQGRSGLFAQPGVQGLFLIQGQNQSAGLPLTNLAAPGDILEFVDGSMLHGGLKQMDASGLRWESPEARNPIDFHPDHIDSIRFAHADSVAVSPTSHICFANGDDLFGSVTSLDDDHLGFSTWFGSSVFIPRASVQTITFLSSNYTILYDGPGDTEGWLIGNHNPESWSFHDGAFVSGPPGTLARDFGLSGSSTIEFDLAWSDPSFELLVDIYVDAVAHLDYGNPYLLEFTRNQVNLRHIASSQQVPFRTFGTAPLAVPDGKSKVRITIQSNKEEGTVAVFADGVLAKRWKDENGFSATGSGISFQQERLTSAMMRLSNIRISQWEGRYEPEASATATNVDAVHFINHDQAVGKIAGISGGKISLNLGEAVLQIPLQRVTQINFATPPVPTPPRGPWEVRAHFPRGGSLSFQLEKWNDKEVAGRSSTFGSLAFQPGQIRQLEFNLGRPKPAAPTVTGREFEDLDE